MLTKAVAKTVVQPVSTRRGLISVKPHLRAVKLIMLRVAILMSVTPLLLPASCHAQLAQRNSKVETLLQPLGPANDPSVYTPDKSTKEYKHMVDQLRNADPETLRLLMSEVTNVGALGGHGAYELWSDDAKFRAVRLAEAFRIVGTNVAPLLPELRNQFLSVGNASAAECGLLFIGEDAWPIFLQGLTNSNLQVQLAAMDAMRYAPHTYALLAFPRLSNILTNRFESTLIRSSAEASFGPLAVDPKLKVPVWIQMGEVVTNGIERNLAVHWISQSGVTNKEVRKFLEQESHDKDKGARALAVKTLQELNASK